MEGATLKRRAVLFALAAGAVAFAVALTLAATSNGPVASLSLAHALGAALVCAGLCWAAARRAISTTADALDSAIARLATAAQGDLTAPIPDVVGHNLPELARAMTSLFQQTGANIESVHRLAMFDPVTGLANRTNFRRSCERLLTSLRPGTRAALFFIDLDRFKAVNDTLGHAAGDMLLAMVANRLRAIADRVMLESGTAQPLIGRLAGDEFTMFFHDFSDSAVAMRVGRGVLFALAEPFEIAGHEVEIGASIGIALRPDHGTTLTELMRAADAAMYQAKAAGRGRAEYFSETLAAELADREQLEVDLRDAIDQRQFDLAYQPQVSAQGGRLIAAEALLRWRHPRQGITLPGTFLKRAEETGLILEIGEWVIATIAETIARWSGLGVEHRFAINISRRQLDHTNFFGRLRAAMQAAGAPARLLELEISETLAMHCGEETMEAIEALRVDGATIAIDDFGTGYSNLARLQALPIDRIKLDRSLIEHVATRPESRAIVQAVIGLIHGLGCEAVAKGVENDAQAEVLRVIGCDVLQGYAIAKPMDETAFIAWSKGDARQALAG
ncbi:MAG: putative bifunctional diguanylate cyclase/phosphodiesterase [Sphingomonas sp.]